MLSACYLIGVRFLTIKHRMSYYLENYHRMSLFVCVGVYAMFVICLKVTNLILVVDGVFLLAIRLERKGENCLIWRVGNSLYLVM